MSAPIVSVVVPTRNRAAYLEVTLRSLARQDLAESFQVLVVDDGSTDSTPEVVRRAGVRAITLGGGRGVNAARNAGAGATGSDLIALVDDDVLAPPGWLREMVDGAARHPGAEAFGGPIRARLEGPAPRSCGRERPPVTTLDLGPVDRPAELVWSANMLVRRSALERVGPFDESLPTGGDEEEWLRRLRAGGGSVMYLAAAGLDHRRVGDDARLRSLMASAYGRGRNLRAWDRRRGVAPPLRHELRVLAGCGWHTVRRACPQGLVMGAHSAGRALEAVRPRSPSAAPPGPPDPATFLSGETGHVAGTRRIVTRAVGDRLLDLLQRTAGGECRLRALDAAGPTRAVTVLSVYRPGGRRLTPALAELRRSRHALRYVLGSTGDADPALAAHTVATGLHGGKFENLATLWREAVGPPFDWVLVVDDDVVLPGGFGDRLVALAERFDLALAQPAQTLGSHAAWRVTRRRPLSLVRETRFVEIGPVTLFRADAARELLPPPPLRYGWGLDLHWAAVARDRGWRLGIVDAVAVRHADQPVAAAYGHAEAIEEARAFLAERPYVPAAEVQRTLATHRR